jgi:hypothetical protein
MPYSLTGVNEAGKLKKTLFLLREKLHASLKILHGTRQADIGVTPML